MLKKFFSVIVVCIISINMFACGGKIQRPKKFVGTYETLDGVTMILNADGSCILNEYGSITEWNWYVKNNELYVEIENNKKYLISVSKFNGKDLGVFFHKKK